MFSFRCSTSRYTEVERVIFLMLQILLLDGNERTGVSFEERDLREIMLGGFKNQRYLLVIRKNMRAGKSRTGCTLW
jgi:hypothetical protein